MSDFDQLEQWAAQLRRQEPPQIDVTSRVVESIRHRPRPVVFERPSIAVTAVAVVAASAALLMAWQSWQTLHDPLFQLFEPRYSHLMM
jgi:hypothetical protein